MENREDFFKRLDKLKDYEKFTGKKIRFEISPFNKLMGYLGYPNKKILFPVSVTGTKGKGSTSAFLSAILYDAKYSTGLFSSPHVIDLRERIRINEKWIDEELFEKIGTHVLNTVEKYFSISGYRTFFEVITATAMLAFIEKDVEFGIFEVGLGGRLDATSVMPHKMVIINTIDIEHRKTLGKKLLDIAWEKTALIKPKSIVIIGKQRYKYITEYIIKRAKQRGAYPITIEEGMKKYKIRIENNTTLFIGDTKINPSLWGQHQMYNATLAIIAANRIRERGYKIRLQNIKNGLESAIWRGRLEIINEKPLIIVDGAHTPLSVKYALESVKSRYPNKKIVVFMALLRDKRIKEIAEVVAKYTNEVYLSEVAHKRTANVDDVKKYFSKIKNIYVDKNLQALFYSAKMNIKSDELLLVIGSLYIIGNIIKYVKKGD